MNEESKRIRRSLEERVAEIDKKIEGHEKIIAKLKSKKEALLNPQIRTRKNTAKKAISTLAKEYGIAEEDVRAMLEARAKTVADGKVESEPNE